MEQEEVKVQMEAADTDKDGYDELVVTVSMNDTHYGEKLKHLGTQVFIFDKLSSGWTLTARFSMSKDGVSTDNSRADDRYRMVWGTSTVGNVIASDDSGVIADFPEIVTVGMQDNESKDFHNINVDGDDTLAPHMCGGGRIYCQCRPVCPARHSSAHQQSGIYRGKPAVCGAGYPLLCE